MLFPSLLHCPPGLFTPPPSLQPRLCLCQCQCPINHLHSTPPAAVSKNNPPSTLLKQTTTTASTSLHSTLPNKLDDTIELRLLLTVKNKIKETPLERIHTAWHYFVNGIGKGITVQLVSEIVDPDTKVGKRSSVEPVRGWLPKSSDHPYIVDYAVNITVPSDFGHPGAIIITNLHDKEFFLMEVAVHGFRDGPTFFPANSWIHSHKDNPTSRLLFNNKAYLPSQTPDGLKDLRQYDLICLRGNGKGERKKHERIYDYAPYNDLGNPDKSDEFARPVLGGLEMPYPRRCRTGRPSAKSDPSSESTVEKQHPLYVPRDETFEELKENAFSTGRVKALLHNLIPTLAAALSRRDSQFECFSDIDRLYKDGFVINTEEESFMDRLIIPSMFKSFMTMGNRLLKYEIPSIISRDRFSWLRDNEFARQTLAGVNPVDIQRLREFPIRSSLDPTIYGPQESAITKEILEHELNGMSLEEAMEKNRLFIIDYHDILLPYIRKINSLKGKKIYASRTIFLITKNGILRPIAIELSLPPSPSNPSRKRVYTHGHDATTNWIWKLAKAHVCTNDAGIHQLVNHWLRTHACMEPYIIAAHRQLSSMHPVFKLLHPHMRYTMEINALARQSLINGGGIIESLFSPGKYSMELSSAAYKSMWRFDMEALPADLMRRPSRSDEHPPPHVEAQIEAATRDYFHHLAPKRHAKPSRSDPNVDALLPPAAAAAAAPIPELAKFQDLEAHSQKIACESDGRVAPTEEYMATDYYDDLNSMDKHHHTTGSGFIKVEGASASEWEWNVKNQNAWTGDHNNHHAYYASQGKGNPATNDWIPSAHAQTHTLQVSLESSKPHRSDN